jgi:hypothetical protein
LWIGFSRGFRQQLSDCLEQKHTSTCDALTGLLQLAAFCFWTIKSWSGFADNF